MKLKRLAFWISACVVISLLFVGGARAATQSHQGTISLATTNWTEYITIPKFDPALGTLDQITFTLSGHVEGLAQFESFDASPSTVTMDLSAIMQLQRPNSTILVEVIPLASTSDAVTAYDQTFDYGGTSGRTYDNLSDTKVESKTSPPPLSDLTLFTGLGDIILPVVATAHSSASNGGNIQSHFSTSASACATVEYTYTAIPEPSGIVALLVGLGSLIPFRRMRRK